MLEVVDDRMSFGAAVATVEGVGAAAAVAVAAYYSVVASGVGYK